MLFVKSPEPASRWLALAWAGSPFGLDMAWLGRKSLRPPDMSLVEKDSNRYAHLAVASQT